ncbi:hypothetical protein B2D07_04840 [Desulfococcus multivorans]|nr:hypothetical protein B2D07_04840 [Desulfococcus multivorans]
MLDFTCGGLLNSVFYCRRKQFISTILGPPQVSSSFLPHKFMQLQGLNKIMADIYALEQETEGFMEQIVGEAE